MRKIYIVLIAVVLCIGFSSCETIRPKPVLAQEIAWDGTNQNAGFLGFYKENAVLSSNLLSRYNILITKYGGKFIPPIKTNSGITFSDGKVLMDKEHLEKLIIMSQWQRNGR